MWTASLTTGALCASVAMTPTELQSTFFLYKLEFDVAAWKTDFDCCVLCDGHEDNSNEKNDWKDLPDYMSLKGGDLDYDNT